MASSLSVDLTGRVAIVTGAAGGIGKVFSRALAESGAQVIVADFQAEAAAAFAQTLNAEGLSARHFAVDVTKPAATQALADFARAEFGRIDILVNNAAFMEPIGELLLTYPIELWQRTLDVNLTGPLNCIRAVAPLMIERKHGRIVNISSIGSYSAGHAYGVSKLGLNGLTSWLAQELGHASITVNAIAPGMMNTAQGDKARPPGMVEGLAATIPLKPVGEPADLVGALLFLVSDAAAWVTGDVIRVDGGYIKSVI